MIKKLIIIVMAIVAIAMPQAISAQTAAEEYFYVNTVQLDEEGKGTVDVYFVTPSELVNGIQMNIFLPKGFEVEKNKRGKYVFTFNTEEGVVEDHSAASAFHDNEKGTYISVAMASFSSTRILPGDNRLFSFNITAPEGYDATEEGSLRSIIVGGDESNNYQDRKKEDAYFEIKPYSVTTGLDDINAAIDAPEAIYNLNGIRVNDDIDNLPSGIYIVRKGNTVKKILK